MLMSFVPSNARAEHSFTEEDTIHIYGSFDFPPYEFIGDKGQATGFNADIMHALMQKMDAPYTITLKKWNEVLKDYRKGKADVIMGMSFSEKRAKTYQFGMSYASIYHEAIYRQGQGPYRTFEQLKNKRIIIEKEDLLEELLLENGFSKNLIFINNTTDGIQMLSKGKADVMLCDREVALYIINKEKIRNLDMNDLKLIPKDYGYACKSRLILSEMDYAMMEIKKDGTYEKLYNKWFNRYDNKKAGQIILISILCLVFFSLVFITFIYLLKRKVNAAKRIINQQNEQLRESIRRAQYAINSSRLILWEIERNTMECKFYNKSFTDMDKQGKTPFSYLKKYIYPDDLDLFMTKVAVLKQGKNESISTDARLWYDEDKNWHYCNVTATPFAVDDTGTVTKYVGFLRDDTKTIQLNEDLRIFSQKMNYILQASNIQIWEYDIRLRELTIFSASNTILEKLSYEEYIRRLDESDREDVEKLYAKMDKGEIESFSNQRKLLHPLGKDQLRYIIFNGIRLQDKERKTISYFGLRRDITDFIDIQHRLEEEKKKAQMADKLKSAFLANMSHEIRTPLNAIVGFSNLLKDTNDEEEKDQFFKIIQSNNELLLQLINDILDLSKIESGYMEMKESDFDLAVTFRELATSLQQRCSNSNIEFLSYQPYEKCIICADKNRLSQIITNFMTNALKYTAKGFVRMGYDYEDGGIKLFVEDSGIGIAEKDKPRIFHRFEKLNDFAQGTGLGLSICKAITDTYKGKIGFKSAEGKGSTFWAWIPCPVKDITKIKENGKQS